MKHCRECGVGLVAGKNWYLSHVKQHDYICMECKRSASRQWREAHHEEKREYDRRYGAAHSEERAARCRQWYKANPDKVCESNRLWAKANPDKGRENSNRYRARKAALPATLTEGEWQEVLAAHDHKCAYCGAEGVPLAQEHKMPASRGGGYTKDNIVPACALCNSRKGTKTAEEFMARSVA